MQNYTESLLCLIMIALNAYFARRNLAYGSRFGAACSLSAIACFIFLLGLSLHVPK